jgi:hypothetical protein
MVGTVGYAPTTSRMSIEHSTIELCSLTKLLIGQQRIKFLYINNYPSIYSNIQIFKEIGKNSVNYIYLKRFN